VSTALREALAAGRFCYVVELVASALKREAQVLEVASQLAGLPEVVAGSITSYAGGAIGHDPIRVGTAARARGLAPNVHLTCVSQDRRELRKTLEDLHALGIENVFALTGDYPASADPSQPAPIFDLDSVQLVRLIDELRQTGMPFHVSVAVSPFKYREADCVYQYVKLEKKIAAGADLAITQVGWDVEKFRELRRYLDERRLRTPVLGNVYVLTPRAAERMATGQPPGCWVSPALLDLVRSEQASPDRGGGGGGGGGGGRGAVAGGSSVPPARPPCCVDSDTRGRTSGEPTTPPRSRGSSDAQRSWLLTGSDSSKSCASALPAASISIAKRADD
jgi:5,10-methylenetetrahydrofolate reductase